MTLIDEICVKDKKQDWLYEEMCKRRTKSPYGYVRRPLINGDPNKKTIEQIIELITNRYTVERLLEVKEDEELKSFFDYLVESFSSLFAKRDGDFQRKLACALIEMIIKDYSSCELNVGTQYFLAAIIHSLFFCFRERPDDFREVFCQFDAEEGKVHAFCRYVVINEIEMYCCCVINAIRDWHYDVINSDGEVFEKYPLDKDNQRQVSYCLWEIDKANDKYKKIKHFDEFLQIEVYTGVTSAYRTYRKDLKKSGGIIV